MIATRELEGIEFLWEAGLAERFELYRAAPAPSESVALAAALVETALVEQRLGAGIAPAGPLLVADLCLARASRLLAESASQALQIEFARAVEAASAAAAGGDAVAIRPRLLAILREAA
jgi:hypothetical protein